MVSCLLGFILVVMQILPHNYIMRGDLATDSSLWMFVKKIKIIQQIFKFLIKGSSDQIAWLYNFRYCF